MLMKIDFYELSMPAATPIILIGSIIIIVSMQGVYNIMKHSLLPLVYRILGPASHISYVVKDPQTSSLLLFNPLADLSVVRHYADSTQKKYLSWLVDHVANIESQTKSRLKYVVANHSANSAQYTKLMHELAKGAGRSDASLLMPNTGNNLKPEVVGEISVCFIEAGGYQKDYNLIGVTHMSPTSTKVPVLFVENLLGVSRIDHEYDVGRPEVGRTDEGYVKSLDKVKYFPNETYIFPSTVAQHHDLLFAKAIIEAETTTSRASELVNDKIKMFQENHKNSPDCLIPTTVLEEKVMNPFLNPEKYSRLLGVEVKDKNKCFSLLRSMRNQWNDSKLDE